MDGDGTDRVEAMTAALHDECARCILARADGEFRSASELAERCDADPSTVYRWLDRLAELDLLVERQAIAPDGNHYKEYAARFEAATIRLDAGEYVVDIERSAVETAADRLTDVVERLRL